MPRYIDADNAKIDADERGYEFWISGTDIDNVKQILDEQPTADVQEVRHGKWIKEYTDGFANGIRNYKLICSCCNYSYLDNHCGMIVPEHFNFCPNCGAKMDGDEDK